MKKIILLLAVLIGATTACKKDFGDINIDTKNPSTVPPSTLFSYAQKQLSDIYTEPNVNTNIFRLLAQQWTETTYTDEANYDLATRNIPQNVWNRFFVSILKNLDESKKLVPLQGTVSAAAKKNQLASIEIMTVMSYATLVEIFGNIPYTQALDFNNLYPKYDDGKTVYLDLLKRLDAAIASIDASAGGFDANDLLFEGDMAAWKRFGNSLKLRMGMVMADADAATAKTAVEAAAKAGIITKSDDNAYFHYLDAPPNTNQIWVNLVQSGRKDYVAANTIVDIMKDLADPRVPYYFTKDAKGAYSGGIYAASNNYATFSKPSSRMIDPAFEAILFDAAEGNFLLAEAAERGFSVGGTAADFYKAGIQASMTYWEVPAAEQTAYLALPKVAYTTATGDWRQKIGTQKWLALYNRGLEAWTEWRRFDYPRLNVPSGKTYGDIPVRYTYPVQEQNLNTANWQAASTAIGGDKVTTKLFWDKR